MTNTPIDRESVERLVRELHDCDELPGTLLALRAALDEAEARADRLEQRHEVLRQQLGKLITALQENTDG